MANLKAEFNAEIIKHPGLDAAFIEFPFNTEEYFGSNGRIKIKATFDDFVEYRGSLVKMDKDGCHLVGLTKEIRKKLNKEHGSIINVVLEKDLEERIVEIPSDLKKIFESEPEILEFFNNLAYTHRKEYVRWIEDAKKRRN